MIAGLGRPVAAAGPSKNVLVVYSNSRLLPANVEADRGLRASILAAGHRPVELFDEFLDKPRFAGPDYDRAFAAYLAGKFAARQPDVIVASGASALDFLLDHRSTLFPEVPVVHMVVVRWQLAARQPLPKDVIGVPYEPAFAATIEQALRWHPQVRRLVIVTGASPQDQEWERPMRLAAGEFQSRVSIEFMVGLPFDTLLTRLAELADDAVVLTTGYFQDGTGRTLIPRESVEAMVSRSKAPIYTPIAPIMGTGTVGGYMAPVEAMAQQAGATVVRLLDGTATASLNLPDTVASVLHVDWRQIQRWGINPASIPRDAITHFRSPTFFQEHKNATIATVAAFLVQTGLIVGLLIERKRRRVAEQETERHRFELARASRLVVAGELTASIAHEINQPLGAILSNADAAELILQAGPDRRDELRAILADIRRDDLRASDVIRRLRTLVARHEMERQPFDLNEAVREVQSLLAAEAQRRRVTLDISVGVGDMTIVGDRVLIDQVLVNLLLNAMDAVADLPDHRRTVSVSVQQTAQHVHIAVTDRGPGIAVEHLPRLFDSFFTTKGNGMGLGLSIARSLVEAHGGHIRVENGRDHGAVFHLELPVQGAETMSSPGQP